MRSSKAKGKQKDADDATGQSSDEDKMTDETPDHTIPLSADPDSYLYAKRKLKKAVIEHYR